MTLRHMMIASTAVAALLAASNFGFAAPQAGAQTASRQGFCRQAEPLPKLPAEPESGQEQGIPIMHHGSVAPLPSPPPPPPPPPAPSYTAPVTGGVLSSSASDSVARAERSSPSSPVAKSAPSSPDRGRHVGGIRPPRNPQSGLLTAGEYDDLLNPELYAAYVKRSNLGQQIPDLPHLDTMRVMTVEVKDRAGQPVPFAQVKLTCQDGNSLTMATQADGRAVFFPNLDRLSPRMTIDVTKAGRSLSAPRTAVLDAGAGGQSISVVTTAQGRDVAQKAKALDLLLVIDTTGSMGDEIRYLQAELTAIVRDVTAKHRGVDIRVGFVFYRDIGDAYVTRTVDFDQDMARVNGVLAKQNAAGGGDYPEAMEQALMRAVGASWRDGAVKSLMLVADAPPHDDKFGATWAAAEAARAKRIHITPVAASGVGDKAEYVMRSMAALTQSRYTFLTDDSGIGNAHAAPAVDCYLVTRLDALLRRVIDSQLSGRRIEPEKNEVIRQVGEYDRGKCILPADFRWQ
jgi:hypothetical protein